MKKGKEYKPKIIYLKVKIIQVAKSYDNLDHCPNGSTLIEIF
jgi:hypothetical protein